MKRWFLLALLALSACDGGVELQPLESDDVIVAFGDSLTAGKGVGKEFAYPSVLAELTGLKVVNAGISGETTAEGLQRLESVLDTESPDLLILFEGGNDILQNMDLLKTKRNLDQMIGIAESKGVQVALVGVPQKALFSKSAQLYSELSETHDLPFEGEIVASLLRKPAMKSDSVHFNKKGYRALAESIQAMLQEAGALN